MISANNNNDLDKAINSYHTFLLKQPLYKKANQDKIDRIFDTLGKVIVKLSVRQGSLSKGMTFFQKAIDNHSYKEWSYYHLGNIWLTQSNYDRAIFCYKKAVEIRPKFSLGLLSLGELLQKKGRRNQAFQCGLKIIHNYSIFQNKKLNIILVSLLLSHSNPKKSQEALQKVVEQIENSTPKLDLKVNTYFNIGKILRNQGKLSEASEFYQKSVYCLLEESKPEFVNLYWEIGKLQKPDFLGLGFAKCGTTAFYHYLCQHPQVLPPVAKEPGYLQPLANKYNNINIEDWSLSSLEQDLYLAHFPPRPEGSHFVTGEASNNNTFPGIEKIIWSWFPSIKLIVLLRNPVRRTISHYEQRLKMGNQKDSLVEVINSELDVLEGMSNPAETIAEKIRKRDDWRRVVHVASSLYVYHLERWMNLFPRKQFLIVRSEDLAQFPAETMNHAFDFLGLSECNSIQYDPVHVGYYPQADADLLARLSSFYKPHNHRLEKFLCRKFNWD